MIRPTLTHQIKGKPKGIPPFRIMGEFRKEILEIRRGNIPLRDEILEKTNCRVWTQSEIDALNFLLRHASEFRNLSRHPLTVQYEEVYLPKGIEEVSAIPTHLTKWCMFYILTCKEGDWLLDRNFTPLFHIQSYLHLSGSNGNPKKGAI